MYSFITILCSLIHEYLQLVTDPDRLRVLDLFDPQVSVDRVSSGSRVCPFGLEYSALGSRV